ncbi:uncharacterized protein [Antedon mediterranea]|uniref:uncharacterized protein n=1 Tax=Antedon mediterranea TaxID=105859 RepID=UPI003AF55FC8
MRLRCDLPILRREKLVCSSEELKTLARTYGIVEENELSILLTFLYDVGEIIYMTDKELLKDQVVLDPERFVTVITKFVTVVDPEISQSAMYSDAYDKLEKGILEEDLLRTLWKDTNVDQGREIDFLIQLMIQFGFICERKITSSQDVPSTSTESDVKRSFFVPLRLAFKTSSDVKPVSDDSQSISVYYDFEGYLPDVLFPFVVNEFLSKFQSDGFEPKLWCNHAELYLDEDHHVTLSLVDFKTKKDERKFLLKMTIKQNKKREPYPQACQKALSTVEKTFEQSKDGGRRGIPFKRCILCSCSDKKTKHIRNLHTSKGDKLYCNITGKDFWTDVRCYKRLFGEMSSGRPTDAVSDQTCIQQGNNLVRDVQDDSTTSALLPSVNQANQQDLHQPQNLGLKERIQTFVKENGWLTICCILGLVLLSLMIEYDGLVRIASIFALAIALVKFIYELWKKKKRSQPQPQNRPTV